MTASNERLLELLDRLEQTVRELREELGEAVRPEPETRLAVEAFADEAFRARDA